MVSVPPPPEPYKRAWCQFTKEEWAGFTKTHWGEFLSIRYTAATILYIGELFVDWIPTRRGPHVRGVKDE